MCRHFLVLRNAHVWTTEHAAAAEEATAVSERPQLSLPASRPNMQTLAVSEGFKLLSFSIRAICNIELEKAYVIMVCTMLVVNGLPCNEEQPTLVASMLWEDPHFVSNKDQKSFGY